MVRCGNLEVERIRTGFGRGGRAGCISGGDDWHSLWKCIKGRRWVKGRGGEGGLLELYIGEHEGAVPILKNLENLATPSVRRCEHGMRSVREMLDRGGGSFVVLVSGKILLRHYPSM